MADSKPRRGGSLGFVVGFAIAIPATIFALSNLESARVEFLGWTAEVPLWAVIAISFLAGAVLGLVWLLTWQARRKRGRKKAAKAAAKREQPSIDNSDDHPALEPSARDEPAAPGSAGSSSTPGRSAP